MLGFKTSCMLFWLSNVVEHVHELHLWLFCCVKLMGIHTDIHEK